MSRIEELQARLNGLRIGVALTFAAERRLNDELSEVREERFTMEQEAYEIEQALQDLEAE